MDKSIFWAWLGLLLAVLLGLLYGIHTRIDNLLMVHSRNHDKIIKLETDLAMIKK